MWRACASSAAAVGSGRNQAHKLVLRTISWPSSFSAMEMYHFHTGIFFVFAAKPMLAEPLWNWVEDMLSSVYVFSILSCHLRWTLHQFQYSHHILQSWSCSLCWHLRWRSILSVRPNFRAVKWEAFQETLTENLATLPAPTEISTPEEFHQTLK